MKDWGNTWSEKNPLTLKCSRTKWKKLVEETGGITEVENIDIQIIIIDN